MADQALQANKSLQNLFASLRPSSSRNHSSDTAANDSPSFSTPLAPQHSEHTQSFDLPENLQAPDARPGFSSPFTDALPRQPSADLMNLLRHSTSSSVGTTQRPQVQQTSSNGRGATAPQQASFVTQNVHGRGVSSSDLVANFMGKPTISPSPGNATPSLTLESHNSGAHPNPQDYLLQLLNRASSSQPKPPTRRQSSQTPTVDTAMTQKPISPALRGSTASARIPSPTTDSPRRESPIRRFGTDESKEPTPFEPDILPRVAQPSSEAPKEYTFTYINPFEQLVSSSPLQKRSGNATPQKEASKPSRFTSQETFERNSGHDLPAPGLSDIPAGLNSNGHDILQSIETSSPKLPEWARSNTESLMGIGAPTADTATVAQALNDVGDQVSRQIEHALAEQEKESYADEEEDAEVIAEVEEQLQDAAAEVKEELEKNGDIDTLKTLIPPEMTGEVKEIIDEAAEGNVDGHHGSADDEESSGKGEEDIEVPVYTFPMRPFVAIDLRQHEPASLQFRQNMITDIARLKKEFDQIDRILATASNRYIVYAMPKPGGFRVIRQDDGMDRQVFKETKDHIFNIAISNAPRSKSSLKLETCIATAMSGKVYWSAFSVGGKDNVASDDFEQHCLVFPPVPAHDDNTSGGQLKTRAKKSSRHPEFFAVGRGKSIQIVFPLHAHSSKYLGRDRVVDTAGYFKDRTLKINMGKAGKDFTFSEDDTVVATLDKAGRLRLWDVQDLVNESNGIASALAPIEVRSPVLTFFTGLANEKSWPTSVLFVDKVKAYSKASALRYVVVGMKQNHTLQLWDLGLGKAVQEINFPHEKESDPICSVAYHPPSGIVIVGHPTRNSIYFIHLSAPKYNLQGMSQAKYIEYLANKDPLLQKPESTAIMSGMREYSFSSKGQIRSIDILPVTSETAIDKADPGLFELYVMHSKGVTCLNIRRADLGWNEDMRVVSSRSAEDVGMIVIKELREALPSTVSEPSSVNGETPSVVGHKSKRRAPTDAANLKPASAESKAQPEPNPPIDSATNGAAPRQPEKSEKRKKKRSGHPADNSVPPPAPAPPPANPTSGSAALSTKVSQQPKDSLRSKAYKSDMSGQDISLGISSEFVDREIKKITESVTAEVSESLQTQHDALLKKVHDDNVKSGEAAAAKQEELLRLVSSALAENVEKSLTRIITNNINQTVIPSVHNVTNSTLRAEVPEWLSKHLLQTLPAQLKLSLPEAVSKAVNSKDVLKFMSDQLTAKIASYVQKEFSNTLNNTILPNFQKTILDSVSKKIRDMENKANEQIRLANFRQESTVAKLEKLEALVQRGLETTHAMASGQATFQNEIIKTHRELLGLRTSKPIAYHEQQSTALVKADEAFELSPEQTELAHIDGSMQSGNLIGAVGLWIHSRRSSDLFNEYFIHVDPSIVQHCDCVSMLAVIAALLWDLKTYFPSRLEWLSRVMDYLDTSERNEDRLKLVDAMDTVCRYTERRFIEISTANPVDPVLRKILPLTTKARDIIKRVEGR